MRRYVSGDFATLETMSRRWIQMQILSNRLRELSGKKRKPIQVLDAVDGLLMGLIENLERSESPTVIRLKRDGMVRFDTGFVLQNMPSLQIAERSLRRRLDKLEEADCILRKSRSLGRDRGSNRYVRRSATWCRIAGALDQAMDDNLDQVVAQLSEDLDRSSASGLNNAAEIDRSSASGAYQRSSVTGAYQRSSVTGEIGSDSKGKEERQQLLEELSRLPWFGAPPARS